MSKSAFVAIVGRPSAGKSTLLNTICGEKISIVTPLPQTTRNKIRGILNDPRGQLVFVDTPGFHDSERKFNLHMRDLVKATLGETELALYVVDSTRAPGVEEKNLLTLLAQEKHPVIIVLNKSDRAAAAGWAEFLAPLGDFNADALSISALTGQGIEELKDKLYQMAPEGDPMYPEEYYTDQDPNFRISEIIREQAMLRNRDEIPHSLYVEVADLEEDPEKNLLWIRAFIVVERESQKGIVVGKGGTQIKAIRQAAQKEVARLFPQKIHLDLRVKASPKWRNKDALLRRLIR
jgi:GTP-binding protein Era